MTDRQTVTPQDLPVLIEQVNSLRDALAKVLDTRKAEAKARASYQVALDNFSDGSAPEAERHLQAMTAASSAENEARVLLATLKRFATEADPCTDGWPKLVAKPIEWEQDDDTQWSEKNPMRWGFTIQRDSDEGLPQYMAYWGESDGEACETLDEAKAWCQKTADDFIADVVQLSNAEPPAHDCLPL